MSTSTRKVLFVMSEAAQIIGKDGKSRETGYWLEEFAIPYQMIMASGWHVDIATPLGAKPTADPASFAVDNDGKCHLWPDDKTFRTALATKESAIDNGQVLSLRNLPDRFFTAYDGVFFPGGYSPMVDLTQCRLTANILSLFHTAKKPTALFCHAPVALLSTTLLPSFLYRGYRVTSFTTSEEQDTEIGQQLEITAEEALVNAGIIFEKGTDWLPFAIIDRELITGQNTASTKIVAKIFINELNRMCK